MKVVGSIRFFPVSHFSRSATGIFKARAQSPVPRQLGEGPEQWPCLEDNEVLLATPEGTRKAQFTWFTQLAIGFTSLGA